MCVCLCLCVWVCSGLVVCCHLHMCVCVVVCVCVCVSMHQHHWQMGVSFCCRNIALLRLFCNFFKTEPRQTPVIIFITVVHMTFAFASIPSILLIHLISNSSLHLNTHQSGSTMHTLTNKSVYLVTKRFIVLFGACASCICVQGMCRVDSV